MEMAEPRSFRMLSSSSLSRLFPSNRISPPVISPGFCSNRIMEKAVTLLPQPDSPTRATVSILQMSNERELTALILPPSAIGNSTERFLTSRSFSELIVCIGAVIIEESYSIKQRVRQMRELRNPVKRGQLGGNRNSLARFGGDCREEWEGTLSQKFYKDRDDGRVELGSGMVSQLFHGYIQREGLPVGPVGSHRVK